MSIIKIPVISVEHGFVHLGSRKHLYCEQCIARAGCGHQLLQQVFGRQQDSLKLPIPTAMQETVHPGEMIEVSIEDDRLISISFLHFLLPLAVLLAATALADMIASHYGVNELWVVFFVAISCLAGIFVIPLLADRLNIQAETRVVVLTEQPKNQYV